MRASALQICYIHVSVRQVHAVHPPAVLGGDKADGHNRGRVRHDRSLPTPACKFFTLTSQNKLSELHAAIGLQLGFGEEMAAIGNIAPAVAISCQDGIIFSLSKKCRFLI